MYYRPQTQPRPGNRGVNLLFDALTGDVAGYRVSGANVGPTALVTGFREMVGPAFHRLARLPSLPRLHGQLILAFADYIEAPDYSLSGQNLFSEKIDGSIFIDFHATRTTEPAVLLRARREAYWSVLRLCTRLGMISGRGVPPPIAQNLVGRSFITPCAAAVSGGLKAGHNLPIA